MLLNQSTKSVGPDTRVSWQTVLAQILPWSWVPSSSVGRFHTPPPDAVWCAASLGIWGVTEITWMICHAEPRLLWWFFLFSSPPPQTCFSKHISLTSIVFQLHFCFWDSISFFFVLSPFYDVRHHKISCEHNWLGFFPNCQHLSSSLLTCGCISHLLSSISEMHPLPHDILPIHHKCDVGIGFSVEVVQLFPFCLPRPPLQTKCQCWTKQCLMHHCRILSSWSWSKFSVHASQSSPSGAGVRLESCSPSRSTHARIKSLSIFHSHFDSCHCSISVPTWEDHQNSSSPTAWLINFMTHEHRLCLTFSVRHGNGLFFITGTASCCHCCALPMMPTAHFQHSFTVWASTTTMWTDLWFAGLNWTFSTCRAFPFLLFPILGAITSHVPFLFTVAANHLASLLWLSLFGNQSAFFSSCISLFCSLANQAHFLMTGRTLQGDWRWSIRHFLTHFLIFCFSCHLFGLISLSTLGDLSKSLLFCFSCHLFGLISLGTLGDLSKSLLSHQFSLGVTFPSLLDLCPRLGSLFPSIFTFLLFLDLGLLFLHSWIFVLTFGQCSPCFLFLHFFLTWGHSTLTRGSLCPHFWVTFLLVSLPCTLCTVTLTVFCLVSHNAQFTPMWLQSCWIAEKSHWVSVMQKIVTTLSIFLFLSPLPWTCFFNCISLTSITFLFLELCFILFCSFPFSNVPHHKISCKHDCLGFFLDCQHFMRFCKQTKEETLSSVKEEEMQRMIICCIMKGVEAFGLLILCSNADPFKDAKLSMHSWIDLFLFFPMKRKLKLNIALLTRSTQDRLSPRMQANLSSTFFVPVSAKMWASKRGKGKVHLKLWMWIHGQSTLT